jgi:hypothetical protein
MFKRITDFIRYNGEKKMTVLVYVYVALYRLCVLMVPMKHIEKMMGIRGEETPESETVENYKTAKLVGFHVNRVTQHLPLKRKCWVRALTARKLLLKNGINSTLYMGVGVENGGMKAHAWLRCGGLYVTGGNGDGFAVVAKFKASA